MAVSIAVLSLVITWCLYISSGQYINVSLTVETATAVAKVDEMFIGVTIDAGNLPTPKAWGGLNFSSEKVRLLASGLAPCYLRTGGTDQDGLTFDPTGSSPDVEHTFTGSTWDTINTFARDVGWQFIFGLNVLKRKNGVWDPTNAKELLHYTMEKQYKMAGFELGNEPDIFPNKYNTTVPPSKLGQDFISLRKLLKEIPEFESTMVLGPDVTGVDGRKTEFFEDFLTGGGGSAVDRITFHHYYTNGQTTHIDVFTDTHVMDHLKTIVETALNVSKKTNPNTPIWLGETSSCYHGGAPGLSDTYIAGFLWLDKLGIVAKMGLKGVLRQSFYGGSYSLITKDTFDPLPDYWLTLLYKHLAGSSILDATSSAPDVRVYAHCIGMYNPFGYLRGTVVLSILIVGNDTIQLSIPQFKGQPVDVFWLEPVGNITSQTVSLNGVPLKLTDNTFPEMHPLSLKEDTLYLPGKTFGFLVFPMADVAVCQT